LSDWTPMPRTIFRCLFLIGLLAALALPAGASAAVAMTDNACSFFCAATVTGVGGADEITANDNPDAASGVQFVASGASAIDAWTVPAGAGCTVGALTSGTRTIKCTRSYLFITVNGGAGDDYLASTKNAFVSINGDDGRDSLSVSGAPTAGILTGGAEDDTLTGSAGGDTLTGSAGSDTLYGNAGDDTLTGGDGDDRIQGGDGVDAIIGGAGRDLIRPGLAADDVRGGDGFDEVSYSERSEGVTVTPDDAADDGVSGEGDNVHGDVEDIVGGSGGDTLTGSDAGNVIDGRAGNDSITGGGGQDTVVGGDGDDTLRARDGLRDSLDCGGGNDIAVGDQIDIATDCETQDLSADLVPDFDGDGHAKPADCNDTNAAIHPGATEVADNGIDENCDGVDDVNLDRDADRSARPADCNDNAALVHPGAAEIPGNGVDEDCSGLADPYPRITATVVNGFTAFGSYTRVDTLKVKGIPSGATVTVTCSGGGCPKKGFRRRLTRRAALLDVRRTYRSARLRSGARLELRITRPRYIGRVVRFTMRRGALPKAASLCLPPGRTKPEAC